MSHIETDLKVIEVHAPRLSKYTGMSLAEAVGSLNLLWHHCWSAKTCVVSRVDLAGIFGRKRLTATIRALEAKFLRKVDDGWYVRGSSRYLRLTAARSKGGHASKRNLIPGGPKAPNGLGSPSAAAETQPRVVSANSGLSTEHRTPNTEHRGSPSIPQALEPTDEAPEGLNYEISKFGNSDPRAHAFFAWCDGYRRAKGLERAPPPGGPAWEWAAGFFAKYGEQAGVPCELAIRACYVDFVGWAVSSGLVPNWGLWLAQAVWEPRYADVRVGGLREALNEAVRFGEPAQRPLGLGPLGIAV